MKYEENELTLARGETILFYSDGIVEAHNSRREMFSFPRLARLVAENADSSALLNVLLDELARFTGADWEQEDDVTLVTLERSAESSEPGAPKIGGMETPAGDGWRTLAEFNIPSQEGNERLAMQQVAATVQTLGLPSARVERLKTAVAEATMNAIEHGNKFKAELPVVIQVRVSDALLSICITDEGGSEMIPTPETPDLEAKLEGLQSPRGWGLFLIQNMVDKMNIIRDEAHHTVELILYLEGDKNDTQSV